MNGFLQRLAAQSLGHTHAVRSTARLPFASNLSAIQPLEQEGSVAEWSAMPVPEKRHTNSNTENSKQFSAEKATSSFSEKTVAQSPESATIPATNSGQSEHLDFQFSPIETSKSESPFPILVEKVEGPISIQHSAPIPIVQVQQPPVFPENDFPAPLMPVKHAVGSLAPDAHALTQRDELKGIETARKKLIEETTEVHVTIGRIEVTAVHAPAPSKPVSKPDRQTLSLDEYLAKRSRGSQ